jgi:5-methylcytosine-specific restriction endonuclease McrA
VLKEVKNGCFTRRLTLVGFRYQFAQGTQPLTKAWGGARHRRLISAQTRAPTPVVRRDSRTYWIFEGRFWWEDDGLDGADVLALVRQRERRKRRQLDSARAGLARDEDSRPRREPVAREIRQAVWNRDGGACVECGEAFDLQYDHIIPVSRGGATSVANLQILCGDCNRAKSDAIGLESQPWSASQIR